MRGTHIFFFICLCFPAWVHAQEPAPNKTDADGSRTGKWVILFNEEGYVTQDQNLATHYYLLKYKKGKPVGLTKEYTMDGTLTWEGALRTVLPDTIDGISQAYFANGNTKFLYHYTNGIMQGEAMQYFESGKLKWKCNYSDNFPDGVYTEYYESGKLHRQGTVSKGKKNGLFHFYRADGTKEKDATYVDDVYNGDYFEYDTLGKLKYVIPYQKGKREGVITKYDSTGTAIDYFMVHADTAVTIIEAIEQVGSFMLPYADERDGFLFCSMLEEYFRKKYGEESPLYPFAVSSFAQYYFIRGDLESGKPWGIKSFELEKKWEGSDNAANADKWHLLGLMLETFGESDLAWEAYGYALKATMHEGKPTVKTIEYTVRTAEVAFNADNAQRGFDLYAKVMQDCNDLGDTADVACVNAVVGYAERLSASFRDDEALTLLQKNAPRAQHTEYVHSWDYKIAGTLMALNRPEEAMQIYTDLYAQFPVWKDSSLQLDVVSELARNYMDAGNFGSAERLYLEAKDISLALSAEDSLDYYGFISDLADYYERVGRYDQAITFSEKSVRYRMRESADTSGGILQLFTKDLTNDMLIGETLTLARLYDATGQNDLAAELLHSAVENAEVLLGESSFGYINALEALAGHEMDAEAYADAETHYQKAIALSETYLGENNVNYFTWKDNLSELYVRMGQPEKALAIAEEVLHARKKEYPEGHPILTASYGRLSEIFSDLGKTDTAIILYAKVLDAQTSRLENSFAVMRADEQERYLETFRFQFDIFNAMAAQHGNSINKGYTHVLDYQLINRSLLLYSGVAARRAFEQDPDSLIRNMYAQWLDTKRYLNKLLADAGTITDPRIDSLQAYADALEKKLNLSVGRNIQYVPTYTTKDVQNALQEDEAYVSFIRYPEFLDDRVSHWLLGAIVVTAHHEPQWIPLGAEADMEAFLQKRPNEKEQVFIDRIYTFPEFEEDSATYAGAQLFAGTWQKVIPALTDVHRVFYTADGPLFQINLSAVPTAPGEPMCTKFTMVQIAGAGSLVERREKNTLPAQAEIDLFGGISFDASDADLYAAASGQTMIQASVPVSVSSDVTERGGNWKYLPGTLTEVQSIAKTLNGTGWNVQEVKGSAASEEVFKSMQGKNAPDVLHIATHGFFSDDLSPDPMFQTGILMAGGSRSFAGDRPASDLDDGVLTAAEVSYLDLSQTSLVVLSACETGLGELQSDEGVFGLQRAFTLAGVQNILMSMWKVSDTETVLFMQTFYKHIAEGKSMHTAYAETQQYMSSRYSPYYWASFVLQQ